MPGAISHATGSSTWSSGKSKSGSSSNSTANTGKTKSHSDHHDHDHDYAHDHDHDHDYHHHHHPYYGGIPVIVGGGIVAGDYIASDDPCIETVVPQQLDTPVVVQQTDTAVATPQATFDGVFLHSSIPAIAAAYLFHLCQNHAFIDGKATLEVVGLFRGV